MPPYRFWKDPVWGWATAIYGCHRLYQSFGLPEPRLLQFYLNDLLFIPAVLPLVLALEDRLGWRKPGPPRGWEILFYWMIWSLICEWVGPFKFALGSPDAWDVLAYGIGGFLAWLRWRRPRRLVQRYE